VGEGLGKGRKESGMNYDVGRGTVLFLKWPLPGKGHASLRSSGAANFFPPPPVKKEEKKESNEKREARDGVAFLPAYEAERGREKI